MVTAPHHVVRSCPFLLFARDAHSGCCAHHGTRCLVQLAQLWLHSVHFFCDAAPCLPSCHGPWRFLHRGHGFLVHLHVCRPAMGLGVFLHMLPAPWSSQNDKACRVAHLLTVPIVPHGGGRAQCTTAKIRLMQPHWSQGPPCLSVYFGGDRLPTVGKPHNGLPGGFPNQICRVLTHHMMGSRYGR